MTTVWSSDIICVMTTGKGRIMRKLFMLLCICGCFLLWAPSARAVEAEDISGKKLVTDYSGFSSPNRLFDGSLINTLEMKAGASFTLTHEEGIGSLYILFALEYGEYTVTDEDTGESHIFGTDGYLHEFLNLEEVFGHAPRSVTVAFEESRAQINELYVFTSGEVPDFVQKWAPPAEGEADLVLFSTHGDDEQLFFTGLLPYYSAELGYNVQVVYLTDHRNMTNRRVTEMLNGLWAVGVRNYPVFGGFGDYYSESLAEAYMRYRNKGITDEELLGFVVENIRRFRPKVAVGHDLRGEYGHGMHMLYADFLCQAVEIAGDPERFPELAEKYGVWDVPKTYLHLYPENAIWMDWDVPLESFDGMTAFEVTKELGFPCHVSQQSYYSWYFSGISAAADIPKYSPCEFGLYRSTVGEDVQKNDFFENVATHAEDALLEARCQAAEEARLAAEAEEKRRAEEAARQPLPTETVSAETLPAQQAEETGGEATVLTALAAGAALLLIAAAITKVGNRNRKK